MTDKPPQPPPSKQAPTSKPNASSSSRPTYISSGQMLESPPLAARFSTFVDQTYNFFGLYLVSLFSLDPFTAAQNSQFNTRGPAGRRGGNTSTTGPSGSTRTGGGTGGSGGPRSGGAGGGGAGGRRLGTVDDVRGPECGSCG